MLVQAEPLRISGGDAENLHMPVGKINPVVDGASRVNGNVYSATLRITLEIV
jgi:hypothetical protein